MNWLFRKYWLVYPYYRCCTSVNNYVHVQWTRKQPACRSSSSLPIVAAVCWHTQHHASLLRVVRCLSQGYKNIKRRQGGVRARFEILGLFPVVKNNLVPPIHTCGVHVRRERVQPVKRASLLYVLRSEQSETDRAHAAPYPRGESLVGGQTLLRTSGS